MVILRSGCCECLPMNKYLVNDNDIVTYEAMLVILDILQDKRDLLEKIDDIEWMLQTIDYRYAYLRRLEKLEDRFWHRVNQLESGYR